jgi:uncharacterized membrane protein
VLALGLGFVTGLRCFTAIAAVAWAAHLGWLDLQGSSLDVLSSTAAVAITSLLAAGEYVTDQMSWTPSRVSPGPLIGRIVAGGVSGAALWTAADRSLMAGAALGVVGAVIGAFTAYHVRGWLVQEKKVKDLLVGLAEDALCLGLAWWIVRPA